MSKSKPVNLVTISDIKKNSIDGWDEFLKDGGAFLNTAQKAYIQSRRAFTPEILFNIITMSIEKFVMAAVMRYGSMPENHTMTDLVRALETVFPEDLTHLKDGLLKLDSYQEICDLDSFAISPPTLDEIPDMLKLAFSLHELVLTKIKDLNNNETRNN